MNARQMIAGVLAGATLVLGGCATPGYDYPAASYAPRVQYGVVEGIDAFQGDPRGTSGAGAVIGGIAGGVIGHQFGSGSGNTAATIAGAVGGAVVGNEVEKSNRGAAQSYRLRVRTDSGSVIVIDNPQDINLRVGDRVRLEGSRIYRM